MAKDIQMEAPEKDLADEIGNIIMGIFGAIGVAAVGIFLFNHLFDAVTDSINCDGYIAQHATTTEGIPTVDKVPVACLR